MFTLDITPEFLSYLLAGLIAILFDWFPGLAAWFDDISELKKKQVMAGLLLIVVLIIYGGICGQIFTTTYTCDKAGFASLFEVFLIAVGINQGIHALTKPSLTTKLGRKGAKANGQGMVEYALILVLVAVVVIAAVTILGPLVGNVFSTVNASLGG